jgi:hypothetical protein
LLRAGSARAAFFARLDTGVKMTPKEIDEALAVLLKEYPNRWKKAVATPILRGWFVAKIARDKKLHDAVDRAAISVAIDRLVRAADQ